MAEPRAAIERFSKQVDDVLGLPQYALILFSQ